MTQFQDKVTDVRGDLIKYGYVKPNSEPSEECECVRCKEKFTRLTRQRWIRICGRCQYPYGIRR